MRIAIFILLSVSTVSLAHAAEKEAASQLPTDVVGFKDRRDLCDHFRGEEPYDEERRIFLLENLEKYCTGTDKELTALKAKYKNNKVVIGALERYEEKTEASSF